LEESSRISSDFNLPINAGTARRPQQRRLSSHREFMFLISAGNASSWSAFPRFLLYTRLSLVSPESSPSSLGSERRRQSLRSSSSSFFRDEIWAGIAVIHKWESLRRRSSVRAQKDSGRRDSGDALTKISESLKVSTSSSRLPVSCPRGSTSDSKTTARMRSTTNERSRPWGATETGTDFQKS